MTNELICKDLIVIDNIKNEFFMYYGRYHIRYLPGYLKYAISFQEKKLNERNLAIQDDSFVETKNKRIIKQKGIEQYINMLVEKKIIPKRFLPKISIAYESDIYILNYQTSNGFLANALEKKFKTKKGINKFIKKNKEKMYNISQYLFSNIIYKMTIKESIISLMIQKECDPNIIGFFSELTEKDHGISFDTFISNWAKRVINDCLIRGDWNDKQIDEV